MTRVRMIAISIAIVVLAGLGLLSLNSPPKSIRVGYAISLTGANAQGASGTALFNYRLWAEKVNAAGGIMLTSIGRRLPIELIEYDDQSQLDKAMGAVERLISEDHADFILPPWGTGMNMGVAPLLHKAGYPHLVVTAMSEGATELAQKWPNSFWFLGRVTDASQALVALLSQLRSEGKLGNRIAMVNVADQFGIVLAKAARRELRKGGFELVYDRSYPVGQQDMTEIVADAKHLNPDAFFAFSYPSDTMAITEAARGANFNPKIFYTGVGTAYPLYKQRFGSATDGVMGTGGWNSEAPASKTYRKAYIDKFAQEPDRWASPIAYASLEILQQAIERVGRIDRAAVIKEIQTGTFQTIVGQIKMEENLYTNGWWVGQWQDGEFHGIAPANLPGARPIMFPKPPWSVGL